MSNDWLLRQLEDAARALACFMLGRDFNAYELPEATDSLSSGDLMLYELRSLVRAGQVNEAENRLFETLEAGPLPEYLPAALDFYEQLSMMNDAELAACRFSHEEISEGIAQLRAIYERQPRPAGA